ncbi:MAG: CotH kinase family protein [Kiritimatiellae bacterium]|nr:CotH kinase family protein [Kiritimatiellia bacterium]
MGKRVILSFGAALMAVRCLAATVTVNEVCYKNSATADASGYTGADWIELYNASSSSVDIGRWYVGDKKTAAKCHQLPFTSYKMQPGEYIMVFADSTQYPEDEVVWVDDPDLELVPQNATWKYYTAESAPSASWKTQTFSDSTWESAVLPAGYNDASANADLATAISYGTNLSSRYPAAYFRYTFNCPDATLVSNLTARVRINDGAVVYLNGTEIYRHNMPDGTVSHATLASSPQGTTEWLSWSLPTNALANGSNTIAVEVHQAFLASTDLIFDLSLTAQVAHQHPEIHLNMGLSYESADGRYENVYLFNSSGTQIHKFDGYTKEVDKNVSYGLEENGVTSKQRVFDTPTPAADNSPEGVYFETLKAAPAFSVPPGFYPSAQTVKVTVSSGLYVYYTLDGSDPKTSPTRVKVLNGTSIPTFSADNTVSDGLSWIRTNPVDIEGINNMPSAAWRAPIGNVAKAVVLRAITINGLDCSAETCGTYFIGQQFTGNRNLPTVSIVTTPDNFFGYANGIYIPGKSYGDSEVGYGSNRWGKPYANYHQDDWERDSHFELFETNSTTSALSLRLGIQMHGGGTRAIPQKTLYMICRNAEYGTANIDYQLFPDMDATYYKRFLLRNSGNDWYGTDVDGVATMLKDSVFHRIAEPLNIAVMAYRPVVVYLNGEFWGIHNLRESYDKHYMATRYGLNADNMDILMHEDNGNDKVHIARIDGDKNADEDYEQLMLDINANPPTTQAGYDFIASKIDITNHTEYIIAETFFANTDWPINNCDFWRTHTNETASAYGDKRWRWMLYDLDVAGEKGYDFDMFDYLSKNRMKDYDEPGFIINMLWKNEQYRNYFVNRYTTLLNTVFKPERTANIIRSAAAAIEPDLIQHYRRWGRETTLAEWTNAVNYALVDFTAARYTNSFIHLDAKFSLGGTGDVTVMNSNPTGAGGHFTVNGIVIETTTDGVTDRANWTGRFFKSQPVTVTAVPDQGYVFDSWSDGATVNAERSVTVTDDTTVLKARFRLETDDPYTPTMMMVR